MPKEIALALHDVKMNFGAEQVLKGINLDVYLGEIIGYIGPNGAGKSTTIKLILGITCGYEGQIEVLGKPIQTDDVHYKANIGYVPESADMYDQLTACEYLTFIGGLYGVEEERAREKALVLLELLGMEEVFHQRIDAFSKGMRQKVLLISALLHDPKILFLDEPLNGLDANSVIVMKEILRKLAQEGKTIFYSSHIMEVVENISDRIILLADGEIVADGSFDQLKEQSKQGSLEAVFNQLTGFESHAETANAFVDVVVNKAGDTDA